MSGAGAGVCCLARRGGSGLGGGKGATQFATHAECIASLAATLSGRTAVIHALTSKVTCQTCPLRAAGPEQVDALYHFAKWNFECGNYSAGEWRERRGHVRCMLLGGWALSCRHWAGEQAGRADVQAAAARTCS